MQPMLRKTEHWSHQCEMYQHALGKEASCTNGEMGTGKSLVLVSLIANESLDRVLVLCPKAVMGVWRREFDRHYPADFRLLVLDSGSGRQKAARLTAFMSRHADGCPSVVVANYDSVWREPLAQASVASCFDAVACDESHRIKAAGGKASRWVAKLGRSVPRRMALTGTLMPHSPLDVYGQFRFLDPNIFGSSFTRFRNRYAITNPMYPGQIRKWINQEELQEKIASITYTCRADDVLDLPEITHSDVPVPLSSKTMRAYQGMEQEFVAEVDGGLVTASNALTKLLRLQQITGGVADELVIGDEKKRSLRDLVEDVPAGEPVVVFGRFRSDLDQVANVAASLNRSYGEISGRRKDLTEHASMPEGVELMGVQIAAGGVGIDLTRAAYAVYFNVGYSLGDYQQSIARLHRPGQSRPVRIYHLVAEGTVDEAVYAALGRREELVESILKGMTHARNRNTVGAA